MKIQDVPRHLVTCWFSMAETLINSLHTLKQLSISSEKRKEYIVDHTMLFVRSIRSTIGVYIALVDQLFVSILIELIIQAVYKVANNVCGSSIASDYKHYMKILYKYVKLNHTINDLFQANRDVVKDYLCQNKVRLLCEQDDKKFSSSIKNVVFINEIYCHIFLNHKVFQEHIVNKTGCSFLQYIDTKHFWGLLTYSEIFYVTQDFILTDMMYNMCMKEKVHYQEENEDYILPEDWEIDVSDSVLEEISNNELLIVNA